MAKKSFDLMLAVGKNGPKSKNMSGVTDSSISAPDQSGDAMAPGGGIDDMVDEPMNPEPPEGGTTNSEENCITLPPGFKAPDGSEDGKPFTTTVRGKIMDGKFYPESIGDMPLDGKQAAPPADEEMPEQDAGMNEYAQKKADEGAAKSVFQPGR